MWLIRIQCPAGHCEAMSREGAGTLKIAQEAPGVGGCFHAV